MDPDFWGGIAAIAIMVPIGLFCFAGVIIGRRKGRVTKGSMAWMSACGIVFVVGGIFAFTDLTLAPRHSVTFMVTGKYYEEGTSGNPVMYYLQTSDGTYEATTPGLYDGIRPAHDYICRVLGGWTGKPALYLKDQATAESCTLAH